MPTPVTDLVVPVTAAQWRERLIALAALADFSVTSWGPGSVPLTLIGMLATCLGDVSSDVAKIANGRLLKLARGNYLKATAKSDFDEEKPLATFTEGKLVLTNPTITPQNVVTNVHLFSDGAKQKYRSLTSGVVPAGGTLPINVRAETRGAAANVANGAITTVVTSLPGVTVSNPAIGTTGTWVTALGADVMTDEAFIDLCIAKWGTLGTTRAAYYYWAKTTPGVVRATVDDMNPGGANTIWVYIDNALSLATLQATFEAKQPAGTRATAKLATATNVPLPGVVTVRAIQRAAAEAAINETLTELANLTDIAAKIYESEVVRRIKSVDGVVDVEITSGFGGPVVQLGPTNYPQFTLALNYVEVT